VTTVVNIRSLPPNPADWPADHVYIGRAARRGGHLLRASPWRNPFRIGADGDRDAVVARYETYLTNVAWRQLQRVGDLRGKVLVCWCWPERCHGHVLARLADSVADSVGA